MPPSLPNQPILSRCRGYPICSRPTLSWGRRGFLPLIEWPILWWGHPPESCAKLLPPICQFFPLTWLPLVLPEDAHSVAAEVPTLLLLGPYSYRGSPRHRVPKRFLQCGHVSASPPLFLCASTCVREGLGPGHVLCVSHPTTGPPGDGERRQGKKHKGERKGCFTWCPAGAAPGGGEERQAKG